MSDIRGPQAILASYATPTDRTVDPAIRDTDRVVQAVQYLNRTEFSSQNQSNFLKFAYDSNTQQPVILVMDRSTNTVLYQMPTNQVLQLAAEGKRRNAQLKQSTPSVDSSA